MSRKIRMTLMAAGFLVVGVFAQGAAAQIPQDGAQARHINTGLFTVAPGEGVNFHVSLDDRRTAAPATVLLRLFNEAGDVVARKDVMLQSGQSTTLQITEPGQYRAHAQVLEPPSSACERRTFIGTVRDLSSDELDLVSA